MTEDGLSEDYNTLPWSNHRCVCGITSTNRSVTFRNISVNDELSMSASSFTLTTVAKLYTAHNIVVDRPMSLSITLFIVTLYLPLQLPPEYYLHRLELGPDFMC